MMPMLPWQHRLLYELSTTEAQPTEANYEAMFQTALDASLLS